MFRKSKSAIYILNDRTERDILALNIFFPFLHILANVKDWKKTEWNE